MIPPPVPFEERPAGWDRRGGLCPTCVHVRVQVSDRGSAFLRCGHASSGNGYPKYPAQPVRHCPAHATP